jgi:[ribosomal protein S5]-alanine N-acetyltransferase
MPALPLLNPPLSDGTVTLRPWHRQDAAVLTALCQDATIVRWTNVPAGYIEQMAHARIAQAEAERRAGRALILAVVDAQTDEVLGACDLRLPADDRTRAEVGYMLGVHARGRGVMTRAVKLISRWAIEQLGVKRVQILAHPENRASIGVAERAGFQRDGILRRYREKEGRREDRLAFSMTTDSVEDHSAR